jgi:hypothetical protein
VKMFIVVFWVVTSCDLAGGYQRLGITYLLHLHDVPIEVKCLRFEVLTTVNTSIMVFTMKTKAIRSPETLVSTCKAKQLHNPEHHD